uniref:G-protein coupled receptors family 1 profile domain-containing protein n=1 Tax=Zonotrichia albicollis TaxID=44394 RepID=A0A8D2MDL9_ZONAL
RRAHLRGPWDGAAVGRNSPAPPPVCRGSAPPPPGPAGPGRAGSPGNGGRATSAAGGPGAAGPPQPRRGAAGWSAAALASQAAALLLIFALSALGNGAVVLVIARHRQLRTVTNAFVLSLSLSELLGALLCLPLAFLSLLSRPPGAWLFGQRLCLASAALHAGLGIAATLTMALLSFDRYCAIVRQPRHKMGRRRAAQLLAAVWLAALALAGPWYGLAGEGRREARPGAYRCVYVLPWGSSRLGPPYGAALIVLCYLLPFAVMCFCHFNICRAVRLAESRVRPLTTYGHLLRDRFCSRPAESATVNSGADTPNSLNACGSCLLSAKKATEG